MRLLAIAIVLLMSAAYSVDLISKFPFVAHTRDNTIASVPFTNSDIESRLVHAINEAHPEPSIILAPYLGRPVAKDSPIWSWDHPPSPRYFNKSSGELARAIADKMKNYPVEYNKPSALLLGDSTAIQLLVKTNDQQKIEPYFKDFEGDVTVATVLVAKDISAQLTGPSDRLQITLRGEKMRTILSPVPVTWVWDVKPLKPGPAHVTLEVTSYIKTGKDTEPVPIRVLQDTWLVEARGIECPPNRLPRTPCT